MTTEPTPNKPMHPQTNQFRDDEIDLFELWDRLYQQKLLIIVITILFALAGLVYSFVATPVYKASAYLLPPLSQDVQALQVNLQNSPFFDKDINEITDEQGLKSITAIKKEVFESFLANYQSRQLRRDFFDRLVLTEFSFDSEQQNIQKLFEKRFHEKLSLTFPSERSVGVPHTIALEANDPDLAARWLNEYLDLAITHTKEQLIFDIQALVEQRKAELNLMISSMRETAARKKADRLEELKEALVLAEAIGLQQIQEAQSPVPTMDYLRGVEAIRAEIAVLSNRESDDAFITGLRDLQRYLNYLEGINIEPENFNVVRVDQYAVSPDSPIKPKKVLIFAIAIILGAMLGVFIALIRSAVKARKENVSAG